MTNLQVVQTHPGVVANVIWKLLLQTHSSGQILDAAVLAKL